MLSVHISEYGCGRPLVLFHGWGFDNRIWLPLLPLLSQFHLYMVDLPGFGQSDIMEWDVFLHTLLARLPDKFAVVGWSMGGLLATRLSIEAPDRVTHLLNIASSPRFTQDQDWVGVSIDLLNTFYQQLIQDPKQTRMNFIQQQLHGYALSETFFGKEPTLHGLKLGLDCLRHYDLRLSLSKLTIPVCYLFGRLDAIVPRTVMPLMQARYPNFQYVMMKKSAHVPFLSHPDEFVQVLEFLL